MDHSRGATTDEVQDLASPEVEGPRTKQAQDAVIIAALASGATRGAAGRAAGVSERTVRRRLKKAGFREQLREAEEEFLAQVTKNLTGLAPTAVETLGFLMSSEDVAHQVRLRACLGVLTNARLWRDASEIEDRIRELESQVSGSFEESTT